MSVERFCICQSIFLNTGCNFRVRDWGYEISPCHKTAVLHSIVESSNCSTVATLHSCHTSANYYASNISFLPAALFSGGDRYKSFIDCVASSTMDDKR
jgi:hypothetical protein